MVHTKFLYNDHLGTFLTQSVKVLNMHISKKTSPELFLWISFVLFFVFFLPRMCQNDVSVIITELFIVGKVRKLQNPALVLSYKTVT